MKITKINTYMFGFFLFTIVNSPVHGEEVWGAWFPAPSPDGKKISFSYYGDIWIVDADGEKAERLTVSEGYESRSLWSPDGQWIAFQTDRWGNDDICVMRANGTEPPERLTYYSTYDALYNWTPDGKSVVFVSPRTTLRPALYRVSIDGGLPQPVTRFTAWHVCYTPDGKTLFYERGNTPWWRRKYRGGANEEIWVKTLPDGKSEKITDHPGRDGYPMYSAIDKKLYFLSDRGEPSVSNIWRMDIDGKN
ncbi:MAG: PD40 domain-containing protein, partial [candidate division WOR-3 bacterium]